MGSVVLIAQVKLSLDATTASGLLRDLTLRLWTLHWQGRSRQPLGVIDACELQGRSREVVARDDG